MGHALGGGEWGMHWGGGVRVRGSGACIGGGKGMHGGGGGGGGVGHAMGGGGGGGSGVCIGGGGIDCLVLHCFVLFTRSIAIM